MGSPILVLSGLILPHNISPEIQSRLPDLVAALGPTSSPRADQIPGTHGDCDGLLGLGRFGQTLFIHNFGRHIYG